MNKFAQSLDYLVDNFVTDTNSKLFKAVETPLLDDVIRFKGVPLDDTFDVFRINALGVTKMDAIIAFKYLEKLHEDRTGFTEFKVSDEAGNIDENDEVFR